MRSNLAHEPPIPQGEVVQFPKKERQAMSKDKFDKGYVMSSRLYRNEVEPFLSDAACRVYTRLENRLNGFNKESDYVSYSQIQIDPALKDVNGARKLSKPTVANGLKELIKFGVITVIASNKKLGNKYKINEVSLVERFSNETGLETKPVQKLNQDGLETKPQDGLETKHTIDIIYRYINIDKSIYVHFSNAPLVANFLTYPIRRKKAEAKKLDEQFNQFWSAYPVKKNKMKAEDRFKKINFKKHSFETIMISLEKHKASFDWQKDNGAYIPHPTTWINGERWNDEIKDRPSTQQNASQQGSWGEYWQNLGRLTTQEPEQQVFDVNVIDGDVL
ncbi:hypothetical protein [Acinetobacter puyangensis]|uniref:hypothetical protein n=1 Tax=Acinetobacter puyangensis TaxID=1096779 RepID=UPI003A4E1611